MFFRRKEPRDVFDPPSRLERIFTAPIKYIITIIYKLSNRLRSSPPSSQDPIRVVCISDTHTHTYDIPSGDILIHAGDLTNAGTIKEIQEQIDWLDSLPHKYKIAIAGNHDTYLDARSRSTLSESDRHGSLNWKTVQYLQHAGTTLTFPSQEHGSRNLRVYGAPQIPECGGREFAFQYPRGQDAWSETVPSETDVLITHTPPKYHRDLFNPNLGCEFLLEEVWRVKPALHVFGHVHAGAGRETIWWDEVQNTYEMAMERRNKGFFLELLSPKAWFELARALVFAATGFLWDRVWGGELKRTVLVNSALMHNNTGVLGNKVQVIDL